MTDLQSKVIEGDLRAEIDAIWDAVRNLQGQEVRASTSGEMASSIGSQAFGGGVIDESGAHTSADLVDIKWILPLNLSDDDVTNIRTLAFDGTEWFYAGGDFEYIGGVHAPNIARYSIITRQWEAMNGGVNSYVSSIAIRPSDGVVFIGGNFTDAGGAATADYLAYDNAGTWAVVVASLNNTVHRLRFDTNDDLYVGGDFLNAGGDANADCIFMWDGSVHALGTGIPSGGVRAIVLDGAGNLWAGGGFTNRVRKWDGATWTQPFTISAGNVFALYIDTASVLYVGGSFTAVDSDAELAYLFKYDGTTASAIGDTLNGAVYDIDVDDDGAVYVAGGFTDAGGVDGADRIAKWNGTNWEALSNGGGASGLDNLVYAMLRLDSGSIIVGGSFNFAGSIQCQSIAIFCLSLSEAIDVIASLFELYASRTSITHDSATITDLTATNATITALIASTLNGKGIWRREDKATDESRTSNASLTNDADLVFNPITAGKKYAIRGRIFFDTAATPDFKFRLGGTATITPLRIVFKHIVPGTTAIVPAIETATFPTTTQIIAGGGSTGGYIEIDGQFEVTVTGTIAFQWAQNTSNASPTKVLAGSWLEILEVN